MTKGTKEDKGIIINYPKEATITKKELRQALDENLKNPNSHRKLCPLPLTKP